MNDVTVRCLNNGQSYTVPLGTTLMEVYRRSGVTLSAAPCAARVNNKMESLSFVLLYNKDVEFVDVTDASGARTYTRSLFFVLYRALTRLFPGARLRIDTPVAGGYYCRVDVGRPMTDGDVRLLDDEMHRVVAADLPMRRITAPTDEVVALFRREGMESKALLLESTGNLYSSYYMLDGLADYYYGALLPSTGSLGLFGLTRYHDGLLLRIPSPSDPSRLKPLTQQDKMFSVFQEHHRWQSIVGLNTVGQLNQALRDGRANDLINVSEALQERRISHIADEIASREDVRMVLISGPSSSGKTTFSLRLSVQLLVSGKHPLPISLDDYFVPRRNTPLDENGEYDFESVRALNLELLGEHLRTLVSGGEVELPRYNFLTGESEKSGRRIRMDKNTILVLEGIHALNPLLTEQVASRYKYKVYVSALTSILLDDHNYIPTTDNRLLRRIVRDYKYRNYSALDTLRRWPSVRRGEEKWIFPYQEEADAMFNSALLFELPALRTTALPLLQQVDEREREYSEAYRLSKFLYYLRPISTEGLPPTSLLREFLGGSTFNY